MRKIVIWHVILFIFIKLAMSEKQRYDGYQVLRLIPRTKEQLIAVQKIEENDDISFWKKPTRVGESVSLMISPKMKNVLEDFRERFNLDFEVFIPDVQSRIDAEGTVQRSALGFSWDQYYDLKAINEWLAQLAHNTSEVSLINVGPTYEGRNITGVHVSFSKNNSDRAIFIEANIHAGEWITSAVATYILNQLLTSTDPKVRNLAESYDWYIVPVANPDGFQYSHEENRLWRKTRVPYGKCHGADPNRNWDFHWNEGGSSADACTDTYRGPSAFSEPCTRSLSNYLSLIGRKLVGYIDFHSFSQKLLIPYAYTAKHLDNFDQLYKIGLDGANSLAKRYGTKYEVGTIAEIMKIVTGSSLDWVKGTFKTPITYAYELRDTGKYGFILPPDQIIPTGEETLDSLITIFEEYEKSK